MLGQTAVQADSPVAIKWPWLLPTLCLHMRCAVQNAAKHIKNMQQQYSQLLIHLHAISQHVAKHTRCLAVAGSCMCVRACLLVCLGASRGIIGAVASSDQSVSTRRFPRVELSHSSLSPSGGKVYCQLAFVVGLKRFAAVSIKRHRSKEMPPTEIPTEEGEEEENERGVNWYKH